MDINPNINSTISRYHVAKNQKQLSITSEKISSGKQINKSSDDPIKNAKVERIDSKLSSLARALKNTKDNLSLAQTAEHSIKQIGEKLQRMRELSIQAANGLNTPQDRQALQKEIAELQDSILNVAANTQFNTKKLLDGKFVNQQAQIGSAASQTLNISFADIRPSFIGNYVHNFESTSPKISKDISNLSKNLKSELKVNEKYKISIEKDSSAHEIAKQINKSTSITQIKASAKTKFVINFNSTKILTKSAHLTLSFQSIELGQAISENQINVKADIGQNKNLQNLVNAINSNEKVRSQGIYASLDVNDLTRIIIEQKDGNDVVLGFVEAKDENSKDIKDFSLSMQSIKAFAGVDGFVAQKNAVGIEKSLKAGEGFARIFGSLKIESRSQFSLEIDNANVIHPGFLDEEDFLAGAKDLFDKASINLSKDIIKKTIESFEKEIKSAQQIDATAKLKEFLKSAIDEANAELSDEKKISMPKDVQIKFISGSLFELSNIKIKSDSLGKGFGLKIDASLNAVSALDISTQEGAQNAISVLDAAISFVGSARSEIGSMEKQMQNEIDKTADLIEDLTLESSRIKDADFAYYTAELIRVEMLNQIGISMLAQANQLPESALSMLQS